jgi:hypothetical protein
MMQHDIRRVALEASCDERTVRRYLQGCARKNALTSERIAEAIKRLSLQTGAPVSSEDSPDSSENAPPERRTA